MVSYFFTFSLFTIHFSLKKQDSDDSTDKPHEEAGDDLCQTMLAQDHTTRAEDTCQDECQGEPPQPMAAVWVEIFHHTLIMAQVI